MGKDHRGQPSGTNKDEGLGIRPDMPPENLEKDKELTDIYTSAEDELSDNVRELHPNRNANKEEDTKSKNRGEEYS